VSGSLANNINAKDCFVVVGVLRSVMALQYRNLPGWGIILGSGLISLVVGVCLYASLPWSGLWLIGTFIAVELIASGIGWIQFGLALRQNTPPSGNL
ncbi:MAG: HdeD family acid-resistance protein, partial [Acetobacter syzygii]